MVYYRNNNLGVIKLLLRAWISAKNLGLPQISVYKHFQNECYIVQTSSILFMTTLIYNNKCILIHSENYFEVVELSIVI